MHETNLKPVLACEVGKNYIDTIFDQPSVKKPWYPKTTTSIRKKEKGNKNGQNSKYLYKI